MFGVNAFNVHLQRNGVATTIMVCGETEDDVRETLADQLPGDVEIIRMIPTTLALDI
jgi:NDP-sugar pyrophosphorylase family protein